MDAVTHLIRRSRLRSFAASARHAFHLDPAVRGPIANVENDSTLEWTMEKREFEELDERFYASLNQYSPEQLSSMEIASSRSAAAAAGVSLCHLRSGSS